MKVRIFPMRWAKLYWYATKPGMRAGKGYSPAEAYVAFLKANL